MKIKWNWGTKLAIWIIAFIVFMSSLVYMTTTHEVNLVEEDYYPKGLAYQTRIEAIENAARAVDKDATLTINAVFNTAQNENSVIINLPDIKVDSGTIMFFRPSGNSLDRTYEIVMTEESKMMLPKNDFKHGRYILKINWFSGDKEYYVEQNFFVK